MILPEKPLIQGSSTYTSLPLISSLTFYHSHTLPKRTPDTFFAPSRDFRVFGGARYLEMFGPEFGSTKKITNKKLILYDGDESGNLSNAQ